MWKTIKEFAAVWTTLDLCRGINEFKEGYLPVTKLDKDLVDSHNNLLATKMYIVLVILGRLKYNWAITTWVLSIWGPNCYCKVEEV